MHDNFTESKSANYSSTQILGRSEPIRGYMGSSARAINLQLEVPIEGDKPPMQPSAGTPQSLQQMQQIFGRKSEVLDFIRSLAYPHYSQQTNHMTYPPPRVLVILGQWFTMVGIVQNWTMTHRAPWADKGLMMPHFTEVNLTIEECNLPYSFQDVYGGVLTRGGIPILNGGGQNSLSSALG
jgi:hypothetical protein